MLSTEVVLQPAEVTRQAYFPLGLVTCTGCPGKGMIPGKVAVCSCGRLCRNSGRPSAVYTPHSWSISLPLKGIWAAHLLLARVPGGGEGGLNQCGGSGERECGVVQRCVSR